MSGGLYARPLRGAPSGWSPIAAALTKQTVGSPFESIVFDALFYRLGVTEAGAARDSGDATVVSSFPYIASTGVPFHIAGGAIKGVAPAPVGGQNGDIALLLVIKGPGTMMNVPPLTPSGWTLITQTSVATSKPAIFAYYKTLTGAAADALVDFNSVVIDVWYAQQFIVRKATGYESTTVATLVDTDGTSVISAATSNTNDLVFSVLAQLSTTVHPTGVASVLTDVTELASDKLVGTSGNVFGLSIMIGRASSVVAAGTFTASGASGLNAAKLTFAMIPVAGSTYSYSTSESGALADTINGSFNYSSDTGETGSGADAGSVLLTYTPAQGESAAGLDAPASIATFASISTESGTGADAPTGVFSTSQSASEAGAGTESPAASFTVSSAGTGTGAGSDTLTLTYGASSSTTEASTGADTPSTVAVFAPSSTESATGADAPVGSFTAGVASSEAGAGADAPAASSLWVSAGTGVSTGADAQTALTATTSASGEGAAAVDLPNAAAIFITALSETLSAVTAQDGVGLYPVSDTEVASGADTYTATNASQVSAINEAGAATATHPAAMIASSVLAEAASLLTNNDGALVTSGNTSAAVSATTASDSGKTATGQGSEVVVALDAQLAANSSQANADEPTAAFDDTLAWTVLSAALDELAVSGVDLHGWTVGINAARQVLLTPSGFNTTFNIEQTRAYAQAVRSTLATLGITNAEVVVVQQETKLIDTKRTSVLIDTRKKKRDEVKV